MANEWTYLIEPYILPVAMQLSNLSEEEFISIYTERVGSERLLITSPNTNGLDNFSACFDT